MNLYKAIHKSLKKNGVFINGDTTVKTQTEESLHLKEAEQVYIDRHLEFASLHIDVPFTKEHKIALLKDTGFNDIRVEREWNKTVLFKCRK